MRVEVNKNVPARFKPNVCEEVTGNPTDFYSLDIVSLPTVGSIGVDTSSEEIIYYPPYGYVGYAYFTYDIDDDMGDSCGPIEVSIVVSDPAHITIDACEYCIKDGSKNEHDISREIQKAISGANRQIRFGDDRKRWIWRGQLVFDSKDEALVAFGKLCHKDRVIVSGYSIAEVELVYCFLKMPSSSVTNINIWWAIDIELHVHDYVINYVAPAAPPGYGSPDIITSTGPVFPPSLPTSLYRLVSNDLALVDGYIEGQDFDHWTGQVNGINGANLGLVSTWPSLSTNRAFAGSNDVALFNGSDLMQIGNTLISPELQTTEITVLLNFNPVYALTLNVDPYGKSGSFNLRQTNGNLNNRQFVLTYDMSGGSGSFGPFDWRDWEQNTILFVLTDGRQELYINNSVTPVATDTISGVLLNIANQTLIDGGVQYFSHIEAWDLPLSPLEIQLAMDPVAIAYRPILPSTNLILNWDASVGVFSDAGVTPAVLNDPVYQLNDQSGNGHHLTQSTLASRPIYQLVDGENVITFDGIDDYMSHNYLGSPQTVYMVVRTLDVANGKGMLSAASTVAVPDVAYTMQSREAAGLHRWFRSVGVSITATYTMNWMIISATYNNTTRDSEMFIGGFSQGTDTGSSTEPIGVSAILGAVTRFGGTIDQHSNFHFLQCVMYDEVHNANQRGEVHAALRANWSVV